MTNVKLLREISALKLSDDFETLDDVKLSNYEHSLASFIGNFPIIERRLKDSLEGKDKAAIATGLEALCAMLEDIYADDLVAEGREFIQVMKGDDCESGRIEAFVSVFLVTVAMLSIDIHMAKYLEEDTHTIYIQKKNKNVTAKKAGKMTILAVDDTAIALTALKLSLQGAPCKLVCVNSGESAMQYLEKNDPDLFILDIEMPGMDGYVLAAKIRETGHEAPIVFLTNYSSKEYIVKALQAGASDFIVKPIYKEKIAEKISKYL